MLGAKGAAEGAYGSPCPGGSLGSSGKAPWRRWLEHRQEEVGERVPQVAGTACAEAGGGLGTPTPAGHHAKKDFLLPSRL